MRSFFFALLLLLPNLLLAQQGSVTWGPASTTNSFFHSFIKGSDQDFVKVCIETKSSDMYLSLSRFSRTLQGQSNSTTIELTKAENINSVLSLKDRIFVLTNRYDAKAKMNSLFCRFIYGSTLRQEEAPINCGFFESSSKSSPAVVSYAVSKDSSKVLMLACSPNSNNNPLRYYIRVQDGKMSKLWEKNVELRSAGKFTKILNTIITNNGEVGVVIKQYQTETTDETIKRNGVKVPSYITKLLLYSREAEQPAEYDLSSDKYLHTIEISENNKGLVLLSLLQNTPSGRINTYSIIELDKNFKQTANPKISMFPAELLRLIDLDRQGSANGDDAGIDKLFQLKKVVNRGNGDTDFLLEFVASDVVKSSFGKDPTASVSYESKVINGRPEVYPSGGYAYGAFLHGDIIDINFKADGNCVLTRIPKGQYARDNDRLGGFNAMGYKDKLLLFYNENEKNLQRDLNKKNGGINFAAGERASYAMAVIDGMGNLKRSLVIDKVPFGYTVVSNSCLKVAENKLAFYASKDGSLSTGKSIIGTIEIK